MLIALFVYVICYIRLDMEQYIPDRQASASQGPQQQPHNTSRNSSAHGQLEKYQIAKMMASGDYVCNDQFGNNYLLVCQHLHGGMQEFKSATKTSFRRTSANRALLTPFEDIQHGGLRFTAYMLPDRSVWLGEAISSKTKSQIYCLSLLYTLVNKVLKPLYQIFGSNTDKWLHIENIWVKQSTIFYVLNERKRQGTSIKRTEQDNGSEDQAYERLLLRKLCSCLVPYFRVDSELKTFLSIIMDALLNKQFTIQEVCLLLNDKKRRRSFLDAKKQKQDDKLDENNQLYYAPSQKRHDLWNKRRVFAPDVNQRRSLISQTLNIEKSEWQQNTQTYKKQLRNFGETIQIPNGFGKKRNSLGHSRMFDFRDRPKIRNSLSTQRTNRFKREDKNTIDVSEDAQARFKTFVKKHQNSSKYYTLSLSIQEKAYKKFNQRIDQQKKDSSRYEGFNIEEEDKKLRSYLQTHGSLQKKRSSTIDIGSLKNHRPRDLTEQFQAIVHTQLEQQKQRQIERQIEAERRQRQKEIEREKQRERQKERDLQRERQREREKEREKERAQREKSRQRKQKQKLQKQKQLQRQRQIEMEKEREMLKEKQRLQQVEKERRKIDEQNKRIEAQKIKNQTLQKNQSAKVIKNNPISQGAESINLDEIQMIEPEMKDKLDAKKKQAEQKQKERLQKLVKPPLPSGKGEPKKATSIEQEIQEIVLDTNKPGKKPPISQRKKSTEEQPIKSVREPQPKKPAEPKKSPQDSQSQQRTKTMNSQVASSCGPKKPISKQVAEYMHMINKMGEGVAKSSRIAPKLEDIQWFTGIYFIYKRFLFERKKIQKWLEAKAPNLTRYSQKNKNEWDEWFNSQQKKTLEQKVKLQNQNIVTSIIKMNKKIMKKALPGNFLFHAALSRHSEQQSKIAVSQVVKQYDLLEEKEKLKDDEILTHINELLNALYIIAQLDGKLTERKPLIQVLKKKNPEELSQFSDFIYDLYIKQ